MTGLWVVSYILLWALVVGLCVFLVGVLRQIGLLHLQLQQLQGGGPASQQVAQVEDIPPLAEDGPAIGAALPDWALALAVEARDAEALDANVGASHDAGNGSKPAAVAAHAGRATLLMFMSPLCEVCQHVVAPLNALAADTARSVRPLAVIRADEQAYRAFLSVFPLRLTTVCDADRELTMGLGVHRTPFGLLYDDSGALRRKGLIESGDDLLALLGDGAASADARARMYPPLTLELETPADGPRRPAPVTSAEAPA
jgi:methylamine dehydrogenase accessory protein MauD